MTVKQLIKLKNTAEYYNFLEEVSDKELIKLGRRILKEGRKLHDFLPTVVQNLYLTLTQKPAIADVRVTQSHGLSTSFKLVSAGWQVSVVFADGEYTKFVKAQPSESKIRDIVKNAFPDVAQIKIR